MPRSALTGSRIRERRTAEGIKQADLARRVGISAAYLNLIEHNRRRIGGKVLVDLARELGVSVSALTEGAQAPLIEGLRDAAGRSGPVVKDAAPVETDRIEEFAGRMPGWAGLIVRQRDRMSALEQRVEALNDRLAHDPFLSDALHEVLSTVTAIRSTAGILNNGGEIDPEWQVRFHRNMYEDSQRLADGAQALVRYLDTIGTSEETPNAPLDEVEAWLAAHDYSFGALQAATRPVTEASEAEVAHPNPDANIDAATEAETDADTATDPLSAAFTSPAAKALAQVWLTRAEADEAAMPFEMVEEVLQQHGPDPAVLAATAGVDLAAAMRRLAGVPPADGRPALGLVTCDGSGTLTFRKPLDGFAPPRFGAACPLWPLYQALLRPLSPVRRVIELVGQPPRRYLAYAICQPTVQTAFDAPEVVEATMLFVPLDAVRGDQAAGAAIEVGTNCRVCAKTGCDARREPSLVLGEEDAR